MIYSFGSISVPTQVANPPLKSMQRAPLMIPDLSSLTPLTSIIFTPDFYKFWNSSIDNFVFDFLNASS